jgi:hypothetical protein
MATKQKCWSGILLLENYQKPETDISATAILGTIEIHLMSSMMVHCLINV